MRSRTGVVAPLRALLAASLLLAACTGEPDRDHDPIAGREPGQPDFAVLTDVEGNLATLALDGTVTDVEGLRLDHDGVATPLDATRAAFVGNGLIGVVGSDGTVRTAACPGCAGVAVTEAGIVTAQDDFRPGLGFDLVVFDDALDELSRTSLERVAERPKDSTFGGENTDPPVLLGADRQAAYVGYLSRNGGRRAGPSLVAAYSPEGGQLGVVIADGLLYDQALSPDGRFLALLVGGSGGACVVGARLEVVDTETMTALGTDPEVPAAASELAAAPRELRFRGRALTWHGEEALVTGGVDVPGPDDCDYEPDLYQRRYDPLGQTMSDAGPLDRSQVAWLGDVCAAGLYVSELAPEPVLEVQDAEGTVTPLDPRWVRAISAPDPPEECTR